MPPHLTDWLAVALIGAAAGVGDLVGRYRDAPVRALTTRPGLLYVAVHAAASLAALSLIRAFGWTFALPGTETTEGARWTQVLVFPQSSVAAQVRSITFTVVPGKTGGCGGNDPSGGCS